MLNIRCITMQKNETYLLDAWIKYYAYLFGIENLYILDNGSTEEKTKEILSSYIKLGCHVIDEYHTHEDFENKGDIICNIIKGWDQRDEYDFVIPIDIDEFIILHQDYPSCNKERIHDYFKSLIGVQDAFIMQESYLNVPGEVGFFSPICVSKCFFASKTIDSLDRGFHHPVSKYSSTCKNTQLGYLHFHNRSFKETVELAKQKLAHRVDVHNLDALKNYVGAGDHLIKYFLMNEYEYYQLYRNHGNIYFYEAILLFISLSIDIEAVFNGKYKEIKPSHDTKILIRYPNIHNTENYLFGYFDVTNYLFMNQDVKEAAIHPIQHVCLHGFVDEKRIAHACQSTISAARDSFAEYLSNPNDLYIFNLKLSQLK
ncbi:unnamed protein product [Commensalibacter communis]|uniref:Glycosyl transferase family 2 n=1 Tax=Commensalibacter communis TaxID=2972786 RepID=A0A9W4XE27_9PROT|nr:glycosyltransferase family 2 protein [Commensalibacter communis]CAI3951970.1 unnamed protein product [Commensalibacter communis]CAI3956974.1 unnamed protein product [Commensalibacter communis]CAI3958287.1 unnamed protein product [Commensalibacter communis]CAI3959063.1 unnamed protein product [Commensalibacter communis]